MQILWGTQILCWILLTQNAWIGNKRDWHCLESMHQSLEYRLGSMSKTLGRNYFFQAGNISNLLNSTGKKLERLGGVHGYLSWRLRISLWQRGRTQIASDYARGDYSKTHQGLAGRTQSGLPVILFQFRSSLLWKQWLVKNLTVLWKL